MQAKPELTVADLRPTMIRRNWGRSHGWLGDRAAIGLCLAMIFAEGTLGGLAGAIVTHEAEHFAMADVKAHVSPACVLPKVLVSPLIWMALQAFMQWSGLGSGLGPVL